MRFLFLFSSVFLVPSLLLADTPKLPETPKKPVEDIYHGVKVVDHYRWLENSKDPAVKEWYEAENRMAREHLDRIPARSGIRDRLRELITAPYTQFSGLRVAGGKIFALKMEPPKEQPFLVVMSSADEPKSARVVVDPNELDPKGKTTIDFFVPSPDGRTVAVSLSENGSEAGTLYFFNVATGKKLPDMVPRVIFPTAGGDAVWNGDSTGVFYTRYPAPGERPKEDLMVYQQVYFHKVGTPDKDDAYVLGKEFARIAETQLQISDDGKWLLATIQNGDGGEFTHYLRNSDGKVTQVTQFADGCGTAVLGRGDDRAVYILVKKGKPRGEIVRVPLDQPELKRAGVVVPQSEVAIEPLRYSYTFHPTFVATAGGLYVVDVDGGPSRLRFVPRQGKEEIVPLPPVSTVGAVVPLEGDDVLIASESFTLAPAWYHYSRKTGQLTRTALVRSTPVSFDDIDVVREFARSKDGTKVPLTVLFCKGTQRDGNNPTHLTGYGGFGLSKNPDFSLTRHMWLEQGGIMAIANLRGGSEYGEEWRAQGNLTNKQHVFDDFIACAKLLIEKKYTSSAKLGIEGRSNGGLLMGAVLTQEPELFRAVVTHVGLYDMLRFEQHANGTFNVPEYGSVKDYEQFKSLHAYSPFHHVKDGTAYPAILLMTGVNDGRVDPAQTWKMAARLQAANASKHPILLRTDSGSGHGLDDDVSTRVEKQADSFAFLFEQLRMTYTPMPTLKERGK
jgi:prolyl oligopeptidase